MSPPINIAAKTALIALARSRRTQRALAHAFLHRDQPMPSLRLSLGFVTSTACTGEELPAISDTLGHRMSIAGSVDGIAYVVEQLGEDHESVIYKLFLRGPRQGNLVPCAKLPSQLVPCTPTTTEAFMLSTRIVQRRALRLPTPSLDGSASPANAGRAAPPEAVRSAVIAPPIRKYALQLRIEPVSGVGPSGASTVTAFLRPDARLVDVCIPSGEIATAIARVTYTGVPNGLGLPKDTVVLLTD
ncbi:MAG TPA: hypothetical protein VH143_14150 [Kofleriaceae bacterium]|nr:hypothetical protein [Kofleriaceae bacterium]